MAVYNDKYSFTKSENIFIAKKNLVKNIYSSCKIEGLNVTFPQTQTILDGFVINARTEDVQTILNLRNAWKYTFSEKEPLSLDVIKKIHSCVSYQEALAWGELRTGNVSVSVGTSGDDVYYPPMPDEKRIKEDLKDILGAKISDTEKSIDIMTYCMKSQMFWDGNKRTAFIAANKYLIDNGRGIITVKDKDLAKYNELLSEYYLNGGNALKKFIYDNCLTNGGVEIKPDRQSVKAKIDSAKAELSNTDKSLVKEKNNIRER